MKLEVRRFGADSDPISRTCQRLTIGAVAKSGRIWIDLRLVLNFSTMAAALHLHRHLLHLDRPYKPNLSAPDNRCSGKERPYLDRPPPRTEFLHNGSGPSPASAPSPS